MQVPSLTHPARPVRHRSLWSAAAWLGGLQDRVREPAFWLVQAGIALVTAAHWLTEAATVDRGHGGLLGVLVHVPVILYVVPVAYAALRYGFEGGLLTGAWAALLAVPNMVVFHADRLEWVGELLLIVVVVGLGAVVALPVERERLQRIRAERAASRAAATSQRLTVLSDIASLLVQTDDLRRELCHVLHRLMGVLDLSAAAVIVRSARATESTLEVCCGPSDVSRRLLRVVPPPEQLPAESVWQVGEVAAIPFRAGSGGHGTLAVTGPKVPGLSDRDRELLETVAIQIGAAVETVRLHREQRQRWRRYLQQITRAQEDERRRIARELHDVAVHELLLLRRHLQDLAEVPPARAELTAELDDVQHGIGSVAEQLRRCSGALRPSVLTHLGLPAALEWLTVQLSRRAPVEGRVEVEGDVRRLPDEDELTLFRIAEEALRNAERHANASSVAVRLAFQPATVCLEVADDGDGFDLPPALEELAQHGRLGLLGMRERAELSGGLLRIDSAHTRGTRVTVDLPDLDVRDGEVRRATAPSGVGHAPEPC